MYTSHDIATIIGAAIKGDVTEHRYEILLTDSRQLTEPSNTLFVALVTDRNDAHQYIYGLIQKGVKLFVVNHIPENCAGISGICFLITDNTKKALQKLASYHRQQYHIPVIGITGSNGKTIVKEWLYQLLKTDYSIARSPKSFNSQIGVPLSVWQLNEQHTLGIFEAGISEVGEMSILREIIHPTIGILTSLGSAHDEGFENITQKLKEKLTLFSRSEVVVVNALSLHETHINLLPSDKWFLISKAPNATLQILQTEITGNKTKVTARYRNAEIQMLIPFTDSASVDNAITCWATLLYLNISGTEIQKRMQALQSVGMRLELKLGINNCVLINDFYNSDINALEIALHHLKQQHRGGQKVVILSDIEQSGKLSWELYTHVAKLLSQFHIDIFIGIGKEISSQRKLFTGHSYFFENTQSFIAETKINTELQFHNAIILLKGARSFGFELISKHLQQKSHDTVLEINLNDLVHNINFYRSQLAKNTKLMCMVKATGYGSGSTEIAFTLQHHQVDYLAVAYADEGVELRNAGIHLPIMVMSPEESSYDDMIDHKLEPELFSFKVINEFLQALQNKAISEPYPVHIKLDTGMHRLGFESGQLEELSILLKSEMSLKVKSIFSHLAGSDSKTFDEFTQQQIALFENMSSKLEAAIGYPTIKHICNSGAITRFKDAHYNMVRLGIGMYGVGFNELEKQQLKNISSLKTRISQIKHLKKGDTVGYNRNGVAEKEMIIATIPIGYADGLSRKTGNGHFSVYIKNTPCETIGNICMDMCMVDITNVSCHEGDEVIVFETNEQLMQLSAAMETIPYEVLTNISTRVKRVYVQE
ncbi:MAG: bifunctional UDP-N-acetylmuramoyl-tripeptide:D-alanyl-D-alanine ligase/alanine racemase [Bacteroidota bacterium]